MASPKDSIIPVIASSDKWWPLCGAYFMYRANIPPVSRALAIVVCGLSQTNRKYANLNKQRKFRLFSSVCAFDNIITSFRTCLICCWWHQVHSTNSMLLDLCVQFSAGTNWSRNSNTFTSCLLWAIFWAKFTQIATIDCLNPWMNLEGRVLMFLRWHRLFVDLVIVGVGKEEWGVEEGEVSKCV